MKEEAKNKLIKSLEKDLIKNISIIGFLKNYPLLDYLEQGGSLLIKGKSDQIWNYLSSENESELKILLSNLANNNNFFASVEDWMIPIITEKRKAEWILTTMRYYLPEDVNVPENKKEVIPLSTDHIGFILSQSNYKQFLSAAYLEERITKSVSAAIFKKKKLVAWGLTHDDGALGSLHVLDDYRKKGYGKEILISLISQIRILNNTPFAQIEEKNTSATKLAEQLGFIKDRRVSWIKTQ